MKASEDIQKLLNEHFDDALGERTLIRLRNYSDFLDDLLAQNVQHPKVIAMRQRVSKIILLIEIGELPPGEK